MAKKSPVVCRIDLDRARAAWWQRQGLGGGAAGASAEDLLAQRGWARTLGGVDVYIALRARLPGLTLAAVDGAVAEGALRVVPAARGCIYLLPERQVLQGLALAAELSRPRVERDLAKVGVTWAEVEDLAEAVLEALAVEPLETSAIRKALPTDAVRSLGEVGKKVGMSSPLPVALRELEFRGQIVRCPLGQRLDTERYSWSVATPGAAAAAVDRTLLVRQVVDLAFRFFAPASVKEISAWLGLAQRDVKGAIEDLPLVPIDIAGRGEAWLPAADVDALSREAPGDETVTFLAFEDNLLTFYGGPGVFVDAVHADLPMKTWGRGKPTTLGTARHPTTRCLMVGPRLVGFWEYDGAASQVVYTTFEPLSDAALRTVRAQAEALNDQVFEVLGHARSFSLDTDAKVAERAQGVRALL